jgi:hypothetical protein
LSGYNIKPQNTGTPLMLGTRGDGTGYLVGTIRRVAIFDRVLTEAQTKAIYDARSEADGPAETPVVVPPAASSLTVSSFATHEDLIRAHNALVSKLGLG